MFFCPKDVCPRHGDVSEAFKKFREKGELTNDYDLPKQRSLKKKE